MERVIPPITDIHSREFDLAMEREKKSLIELPSLDLDEWLSRKPVRPSGLVAGRAEDEYALREWQLTESQWLYSSGLPIEVAFWCILVEPRRPKKMSVGGILLAEEAIEAEAFKTNVGRIVHMGDAAYKARTEGGVYMQNHRCPQVGDTIVHRHFTGLEMIMQNGRRLRIMDDTDFLAWVRDPEEWRMYL